MKILIGVNVLESVNSFVYSNHIRFFCEVKKELPDCQILFFTPYRMSIDNMRNNAARLAISNECDYLMFIDDDVMLEPGTFKKLLDANKDIIMALTFVRGYPFSPMFFKSFSVTADVHGKIHEQLEFFEDYKEHIVDNLVKCAAVGFSCVLIKVDVVKAVPPPYFVTGPYHTEDVYFCMKTRQLDPEPEIYVHTGCPTTHIMMPDGISATNVDKIREFYALDQPIGKTRFERVTDAVGQLS